MDDEQKAHLEYLAESDLPCNWIAKEILDSR